MTEKPQNQTGVRIPPPVLTLILLLAAFLLGWLIPLPVPAPGWLPTLGWMIAGSGISLAAWAIGQLMRLRTTVNPHEGATTVVKNGPYRFTRNPIYLAFSLLHLGIALWVNSLWLVATLIASVAVMGLVVIPREEQYLERRFGAEYLDYKKSVRRWI